MRLSNMSGKHAWPDFGFHTRMMKQEAESKQVKTLEVVATSPSDVVTCYVGATLIKT